MFYAPVRRDAAMLASRGVGRPALEQSLAADLLSASIEVDEGGAAGVDALCQSMQCAGGLVYQRRGMNRGGCAASLSGMRTETWSVLQAF